MLYIVCYIFMYYRQNPANVFIHVPDINQLQPCFIISSLKDLIVSVMISRFLIIGIV